MMSVFFARVPNELFESTNIVLIVIGKVSSKFQVYR